MKPPIKDTPKEDKPPNKGQAESTLVYTLYRKSPLKEDNLSTKGKMAKVSLLEVPNPKWSAAAVSTFLRVIFQLSLLPANLTTPYDGEIRLSRSPALPAEVLHTPSSGVVELYNNGEWKGVCLDDISMATADALCRQLGYSESNRTE